MTPEVLTVVLFGTMIALIVSGLPLMFVLGGIATIATYLLWGAKGLYMVGIRTFSTASNFILIAVPMFIFMGSMLLKSGITDILYTCIYQWTGRLRGGLAVGTVIICTLMAAVVGVSGAATVAMGVIALPSMTKRGYDKYLSMGCIAAGGALGILIPPSVTMIVLGAFAGISTGQLLLGGIMPGFLLSAIFIIYILIRCYKNPKLGPSVPVEDILPLRERVRMLLQLIPPILIVVAVMGSILLGLATPTEAASVGALASMLCAAGYKRLNWKNIRDACEETLRLTCMVVWIMFAANAFSSLYASVGAAKVIQSIMMQVPGGRWGVMIAIQLIYIVAGMFLDPTAIIYITTPIFFPLAIQLGFDPIWLGVLFVINMQIGFLSPPFGYNLFYLKAIVPKDITMVDIYKSVVPFIGLQLIGLIICMIWPQIVLWLPRLFL